MKEQLQYCCMTSSYLIVVGREGEVIVLLLLLLEESELIDQISSSLRGRFRLGTCTVTGEYTYSGVLKSGVSKKGSPGGERGLAVSVGEKDCGGRARRRVIRTVPERQHTTYKKTVDLDDLALPVHSPSSPNARANDIIA